MSKHFISFHSTHSFNIINENGHRKRKEKKTKNHLSENSTDDWTLNVIFSNFVIYRFHSIAFDLTLSLVDVNWRPWAMTFTWTLLRSYCSWNGAFNVIGIKHKTECSNRFETRFQWHLQLRNCILEIEI